MIKKILLSIASIAAVGGLAFGATQAFFSDTEVSTGNLLQAGAIDLQVDNTCYYNGNACVEVEPGVSFWDGDPRKGSCACNWELVDLDTEKFFSFQDLKPGDWEEDTISLHVNNNDSWLCADVKLTSDDNNSQTEPEVEDGDETPGPIGEGELADAVDFIWWADDGDNVLETCRLLQDEEELADCLEKGGEETPLPSGPMGVLEVGQTATVALADSNQNIWGSGPFLGGDTRYIGKGFCFGDITFAPVVQDGDGATGDNGPDERGAGFECNGLLEDNQTQTDSFTADIGFRAVQSRNNEGFKCSDSSTTP